jgi:hypothetical protein
MANRDMPNCLRAVCRGGLAAVVVRGRRLGTAAQIVLEYFGGKNYDDLVPPCVLDFCRRAGRPVMKRQELDPYYWDWPEDTFAVKIGINERAYVTCQCIEIVPNGAGDFPVGRFGDDVCRAGMHPYALHFIALFPMTERDHAFQAQWQEKYNASWPHQQVYGPHINEPPPSTVVVELNGFTRKSRASEAAMCRHATRMKDQFRRVKCERRIEEHKIELFAYDWCLKRTLTQMVRASREKRAELRSRVRRYRSKMRELREDVQFYEDFLGRR